MTVSVNTSVSGGGGSGGGGGATNYTDLGDKTSVNLPSINTPLATALSAKAPNVLTGFVAASGAPVAATDTALQAFQKLEANKADALVPGSAITASGNLTHATHANRQVPATGGGGYTLTLNNDSTGGWINDDSIEIPNKTSSVLILAAGTATLTVPPGYRAYALPGENLTATRTGTDSFASTTVDTTGVIVNAQTLDYQITKLDCGKVVEVTAATAKSVTLPQDSAETIPIGARGEVRMGGAGVISALAGTGATVNKPTARSLSISATRESFTWEKTAANTFLVIAN